MCPYLKSKHFLCPNQTWNKFYGNQVINTAINKLIYFESNILPTKQSSNQTLLFFIKSIEKFKSYVTTDQLVLNLKIVSVHLTLLLITVICYANSVNGHFVHDDIVAIVKNPDVLGQTSIWNLFHNDFWGKPMSDPTSHKSYRPLTVLTFRLNMKLRGNLKPNDAAWKFRIINVLLHTLVVQLITFLSYYEFKSSLQFAFSIGLYFATHPIHTEAVSSNVGRADVLCCLFFIISFIAHSRSLRCKIWNKEMIISLTLNSLFTFLALLSKETGITVSPICVLWYAFKAFQYGSLRCNLFRQMCKIDVNKNECTTWKGKSNKKRSEFYFWLFGPLIVPLITFVVLLWFRLNMLNGSLPYFSPQDNPASFAKSWLTRLLTYSYLCQFAARLMLLPSNLSYDWQMGSIPLITSLIDLRNSLTIIFSLILLALFWRFFINLQNKLTSIKLTSQILAHKTQNERLFLGLCFLVIPFIPASNLFVTVGFVVAERVLYIPSIGLALLVNTGFERLIDYLKHQKRTKLVRLLRLAFVILIVTFSLKTVTQNNVWLSREALFKSGVESVPQNAKLHYNYANLLKDNGNVGLAMHHYKLALSLWPDHESSWNNLATLLTDLDEAEACLKKALKINPYHSKAHFNLASIYRKKGLTWKAISLLKRSIELDYEFAEPHSFLASLYEDEGYYKDANELHLRALQIQPTNADLLNNYGAFLHKIGTKDAAIRQYQRALEINPNHRIAAANLAQINLSHQLGNLKLQRR